MRRSVPILLAVVAAVCVVAYVASRDTPQPPFEDPAHGRDDVLQAFHQAPGEIPPRLQQFFTNFGIALRNGGSARRYWDADRFARELDRDGDLTRAGVRPDDPRLLDLAWLDIDNSNQMVAKRAFDKTEVRSVRWLVPGREIVVVTRHHGKAFGRTTVQYKMRWWLTYDRNWRCFDWEMVNVGGRVTALTGSALGEIIAAGPAGERAVRAAYGRLHEAQWAIAFKEFDKAERLLADPTLARLPRVVQPVLELWRAKTAAGLGRSDKTLALLAAAERGLPDTPLIFLLRARLYGEAKDLDRVLAAGRRYVELFGPDEVIYTQMGNALLGQGRPAEAADEYRQALDVVPETPDALVGLLSCGKHSDEAEVIKRFSQFSDPAAHIADLKARLKNNDKLVEALVGMVQAKAGMNPEALFEVGLSKLKMDDVQGAVRLFLQAMEHGGEKRWIYRDRFAWAMADAGKPMEAYAALSDADAESGFQELAKALRQDERPVLPGDSAKRFPGKASKSLQALIDAHRKRKPQDPWLGYYQGILRRQNGEYDMAERELAEGMARLPQGLPPSPGSIVLGVFRDERVANLVDAGRVFDAYWRVSPRRATFDQLGYRLAEKGDRPTLAFLVWIHGWVDPADLQLLQRRGQLAFKIGDYEAALQNYSAYLATARTDESLYPFVVTEELVRSQLRLGRLTEARATLRAADSMTTRFLRSSKWLLDAAITAAGGDLDKTQRELDEMIRNGHATAADFYRDPDLGRLLRTAPLKRLGEKYPPPPDGLKQKD